MLLFCQLNQTVVVSVHYSIHSRDEIFYSLLVALCHSPSDLSNGVVDITGNSVGDNATYTCNVTFDLIGEHLSTCVQANDGNSASFVPTAPECHRKCL